MDEQTQSQPPVEGKPQRSGRVRRPPLAEIDTWELWQEWKRGERKRAMPWLGLLVAFCMVLAALYAFFFFSTTATQDTIEQIALTIVLLWGLFVLWQRISPRRGFALAVVGLIVLLSGTVFGLWLLASYLSGWNTLVGVFGTLVMGLAGIAVGLPSLNAIAKQQSGDVGGTAP